MTETSRVSRLFYGESADRETLYRVPICKRCGHGICPCCGFWCDSFTFEDPNDPQACCDERCDFDGEVEEIGPVYGMDEPKWIEEKRNDECHAAERERMKDMVIARFCHACGDKVGVFATDEDVYCAECVADASASERDS